VWKAEVRIIRQDQEQGMNKYETPAAAAVCLVLIAAGFWLFSASFEWPTGRLGRPPTTREIWVDDILPMIVAGYVSGLAAIAITRFIFRRSDIRMILYVVGLCAGLVALPVLALSAAISGTPTDRDVGSIVMLFMAPLAVATWEVISSYRPKRAAP